MNALWLCAGAFGVVAMFSAGSFAAGWFGRRWREAKRLAELTEPQPLDDWNWPK